jgi:tetratricopeptide (TPR) repeat protein
MFAAHLTRKQLSTVVCLALALMTLLVYLPMIQHGFVNYDDADYIIMNPHVNSGSSWPNIIWAFGHTHADYWIPLTWISHMIDCQLFGLNPPGHHLTSLLFHTTNTLLLFFLLSRLTGALWRSAFVAALFAWHPLHVESVAWASERKDVLSAFFWLLAMLAYARYTDLSKVQGPKSKAFYVLALFFFACGLMSKPMVVTLPFVLLLLDFWPLQRLNRFTIRRLLLEKIPFFALTIASCVVTSFTQKGAIWSGLPLNFRAANALVSYLRYVSKTFWPADLAVIYPYPHHWPLGLVIVAGLFLAAWSVLFIIRAKRNPYLFVGWFWFLGTLVPVIGLLQSGLQSMADRFTYIPSIGLFILVVWGGNDLLALTPHKNRIASLFGIVALGGCLVVTSIQLRYWENSVKLFTHTLDVTTDNYLAEDCLGQTLERLGRTDDALALYAESVRVEPYFPLGQHKLGMMLLEKGRGDEASNHLAIAAQLAPRDPVMQFDFGTCLLQHGKPDEAAEHFKAALAAKPDFPEARRSLDEVLGKIKTTSPTNVNRSTP